eukprot:g25700.t1
MQWDLGVRCRVHRLSRIACSEAIRVPFRGRTLGRGQEEGRLVFPGTFSRKSASVVGKVSLFGNGPGMCENGVKSFGSTDLCTARDGAKLTTVQNLARPTRD